MKTAIFGAILLLPVAMGCDEPSTEAPEAAAVAAPAPTPVPTPSATTPPAPKFVKKSVADCKPHPAEIDFGEDALLEKEVRRKLSKDKGPITPGDLAQIKSINLTTATIHQIDPCIFPMFTSIKDLSLGPGEYDDLSPLQKLTTLESLRLSMSQVKDLHAIEG